MSAEIGRRPNIVDQHLDKMNSHFHSAYTQDQFDNADMLARILAIAVCLKRQSQRDLQKHVTDIGDQIKKQSETIKGTYNPTGAVIATTLSAVIGIAAGAAGLIPRFAPASQGIGVASTGMGSLSGLFSNSAEARRQQAQQDMKRLNDKEDTQKGAKQAEGEARRAHLQGIAEANRIAHDTARSVLGG